jgi:hypothetical protein
VLCGEVCKKSPNFGMARHGHTGPVHFDAIFNLTKYSYQILVRLPKKVATFSLLPNFSNYIKNPAKILTTMPKFDNAKIW